MGLKSLLSLLLIFLSGYTIITISAHGWNLFPIFLGDLQALTWRGQFNADFTCFLTLSAAWVSWRHHFSAGGFALGALAFFGGALFLTTYLLVEIHRTDATLEQLLVQRRE